MLEEVLVLQQGKGLPVLLRGLIERVGQGFHQARESVDDI